MAPVPGDTLNWSIVLYFLTLEKKLLCEKYKSLYFWSPRQVRRPWMKDTIRERERPLRLQIHEWRRYTGTAA